MKNMFVKQDDLITINFCIGTTKSGKMVVAKTVELYSKVEEVVNSETHFVKFRRPTYKDDMTIFSKIVKADGDSFHIEPAMLRYERFCTLAKEWSFTDNEGKPIKVSVENINGLEPSVALVVMEQLDAFLV